MWNGDYFCDGYRGPYDTYMCQCGCHWDPANRFYATGRNPTGRMAEEVEEGTVSPPSARRT